LCIFSCYAGGWNKLKFHELVDDPEVMQTTINFPIVLMALSDNFAFYHSEMQFGEFFTNLADYFAQRDPDITKIHWTVEPFKKILDPLTGDILENTPYIKFPDQEKFRLVNVGNRTLEISYQTLLDKEIKDYRLRNITVRRKNIDEVIMARRGNIGDLDVPDETTAIIISPVILLMPILINVTTPPPFISAIPGKAFHYLEGVYAERLNLRILSMMPLQNLLFRVKSVSL